MKAKTLTPARPIDRTQAGKRLAILIAILSLVGGTSVFVQRFQVQRLGRKEIEKAELALGRGEYPTAERLFRDYLQVFPDDVEVSIEYAGTLLKGSKTSDREKKARRIYDDILRDNLNRDDVRRSLMKLKIEEKQFVSALEQANGADVDVDALLKPSPDDGELHFFRGQCHEAKWDAAKASGDKTIAAEAIVDAVLAYQNAIELDASQKINAVMESLVAVHPVIADKAIADAVLAYQKAIELDASQKIDAGKRLAMLLRDQLGQPEKAGKMITLSTEDRKAIVLAVWTYLKAIELDASQKIDTSQKLAAGKSLAKLLAKLLPERLGQPKKADQVIESLVAAHPAMADKTIADAVLAYQKAIELEASQKIDAGKRLAILLRDELGQRQKADQVMESLVAAHPEKYESYLARGQYRLSALEDREVPKYLLADVKKDFKTAQEKAPKNAEVYLGLAQVAREEKRIRIASQPDEEKRIRTASQPDEEERVLLEGKENCAE